MFKPYMKAIGVTSKGGPEILQILDVPVPQIGSHDILVEVFASSINPVDMIIQKQSGGTIEDPRVCGYDASGIVKRIGTEVKNFKIGDEVFYASSLGRQGTFAPFHAVDGRVVSKKPESISHVMAAGMPLVTITAWEGLLERLEIPVDREFNHGRTILVVNGGGGLGSMVIQLAKKVLGLTVIATSSREETMQFVKKLGADYVINHHNRLVDELKKIGCHEVDYVFNCYKMTKDYFQQFADVTKPYGKVLGVINAEELDLNLFMKKSISFVQEYMALRQLAGIDIERNGMVLNEVRMLVDSKVIQSTVTEVLQFNLENLREAETKIEHGRAIGKIVFDKVNEFQQMLSNQYQEMLILIF